MSYEVWLRSDIPVNVPHDKRSEDTRENLQTVLNVWASQGKRLVAIDQQGEGGEPYYIFETKNPGTFGVIV